MLNKPVVAYNVLSEVHCQDTIDFCLNHAEMQIGKIGGRRDSVSGKIDLNVRNVEVYAPPPDMGQYEMSRYGLHIDNFFGPVFDANARFFNFEIDGPPEFHVLKYGVGCHYKNHSDVGNYEEEKMNLDTRKLSFSIFLNDDYEGGDLVFTAIPSENYMEPGTRFKAGDMVVFPSYLYHEVEPVTSGVRWTAVGWIHGEKPFK